ncbi:MAG: CsgG/HfaB family protein [bacterium]
MEKSIRQPSALPASARPTGRALSVLLVLAAAAVAAWWWEAGRRPVGRARVAVLPFEVPRPAADAKWSQRVVTALHDDVIATLVASDVVDVLERAHVARVLIEQGMDSGQASRPDDAVRAGRVLQADYVVLGTVAEVGADSEDEVLPYNAGVEHTRWLHVGVDLRVVDVETSRVAVAAHEELQDAVRAIGDAAPVEDAGRRLGADTATRLAERIIDAVAPVAVRSVDAGAVELNRGGAAGVRVGDRFAVLPAALSTASRAAAEEPLAQLEVTRVEPAWARARVVSGTTDLSPGAPCRLLARRPPMAPLPAADPLDERW